MIIDDAAVRHWMDAYRTAWIERDANGVADLFTDDARYQERRFKPPLKGRDAIRRYWQVTVNEQQRDIEFRYELLALRGRRAFVHWHAQFVWLPIHGLMELDAVAQVEFADPAGDGLKALAWDEWIDIREA